MSGTDTPSSSIPNADSNPAVSSPAPDTPAPAAPDSTSSPSSSTDRTAPSSGDTPRSDREGLLAAVRKVVPSLETDASADPEDKLSRDPQDTEADGKPGEKEAPKAPDANTAKTQDTGTPSPDSDPTEADLKRLKPETRRRFERILSQRDEATRALEAVKPDLDQHRQLQGYLRQHQLTPDDANMLLGVGAELRKGNFQGFLNGVMPYVQAAQEALGLRLPPDLHKQVEEGTVSEDAARELTRTRHRAAQAEQRADQATATNTQAEADRAILDVRTAVEGWENSIRTKDPDYPAKADAVRRIGQALLQERGTPRTPQQAVSLVQDAYDEATKMLAKARPAPQPTRRTPSGIHGATGSVAEPKSMKEAALMALENMRRVS